MATKNNESEDKRKKKKQSNGEGSITQRMDGRWMGRVSTEFDSTGKKKRQTFYGKTKKEVREKMVAVMHALNQSTYAEPHNVLVGEWLDTWLNQYQKASVRSSTYVSYEMLIRRHITPNIGWRKLKDLRTEHVQTMYYLLQESGNRDGISGLSPKTIRNIHTTLHKALEQAVNNKLIINNVSKPAKPPTGIKPEIRVLTKTEQALFLKAIEGERMEMAFRLALSTGLRMGELLALRWRDIELETRVLRVNQSMGRIKTFNKNSLKKTDLQFQEPKTKSGKRSVPMPASIFYNLQSYKQIQDKKKEQLFPEFNNLDLVFTSALGSPIDPRNFQREFYKMIEKAELPHANVHCMRHTYATRCLENNIPVKVVSEILGHANIAITLDTYSHVLPDIKKEAADAINFLFEQNFDTDNTVKEKPVLYLLKCS